MLNYKETILYRNSIGSGDQTDANTRRLEVSFDNVRNKVTAFLSEIPKDIPGLTLHDVSHLDSLWIIADMIVGESCSLNPLEGYVLGVSILLHDAGMALASYQGGLEELYESNDWRAERLKKIKSYGLPKNIQDNDIPHNVKSEIIADVLRRRHATQANSLASCEWFDEDSNPVYLIDDLELRKSLATLIGKVALSHHQPVSKLEKYLGHKVGALPGFRPDWVIDPLKIACILRLADAAHLTAERAPLFHKIVLNRNDLSRSHWDFQSRVSQPFLENNDVLVYTSTPFPKTEISAWWLAYHAIKALDGEIREVNNLLSDLRRSDGLCRFAVSRVKGITTPEELTKLLPADGWSPVDTQINIKDSVKFLSDFGGKKLYGDRPWVVLRELLQNAVDAINARKVIDPQWAASNFGKIKVSLESVDEGWLLRIQDNGIGMSQSTLTNGLLKFGESFWLSDALFDEYPELSKGEYEPIGKFGIGFFSVFMVSSKIVVSTKKYNESGGLQLSFLGGLLNPATLEKRDFIGDFSTDISLYIKKEVVRRLSVDALYNKDAGYQSFRNLGFQKSHLTQLVSYLAPSTGINVEIDEPSGKFTIPHDFWSRSNDLQFNMLINSNSDRHWIVLEGIFANTEQWRYHSKRQNIDSKYTVIRSSAEASSFGRASLIYGVSHNDGEAGHVINGIRGGGEFGISGLLPGNTDLLSRNETHSVLGGNEFRKFYEEQKEIAFRTLSIFSLWSVEKCMKHRLQIENCPIFMGAREVYPANLFSKSKAGTSFWVFLEDPRNLEVGSFALGNSFFRPAVRRYCSSVFENDSPRANVLFGIGAILDLFPRYMNIKSQNISFHEYSVDLSAQNHMNDFINTDFVEYFYKSLATSGIKRISFKNINSPMIYRFFRRYHKRHKMEKSYILFEISIHDTLSPKKVAIFE